MATIDSFSGLCGWRAGRLANPGLTHQKPKIHKNDPSVGSRAHPPLTLDSQPDHLIQEVGEWGWGGWGGELFPPRLGLLLFTYAKSAFKKPPPAKRRPLPSLPWWCLGNPTHLMVKEWYRIKALILPGNSASLLAPGSRLPKPPSKGVVGKQPCSVQG